MPASDPGTAAINTQFDFEDAIDDLRTGFECVDDQLDDINTAFDAIKMAQIPIIKGTETMNEVQHETLERLQTMVKLHQKQPEQLQLITNQLKAAKEGFKAILQDVIDTGKEWPGQITDLVSLIENAEKLEETIKRINIENSLWNKAMKELGLEEKGKKFKQWFSLGGQVGMWGGMFREAAKAASLWEQQNYRLYGSISDVVNKVNEMRAGTNMLQAEAVATAKAMMDLSMDPSSIVETGKAIGDFAVRSGASAESSAMFGKQMQITAGHTKSLQDILNNTRAVQEKFGLSGKNVTVVLDMLSRNMRTYTASARDSNKAIKEVSERMMMWTGAAVKGGMAAEDVAQIFDTLNTNAMKYVVLLGSAIKSNDPSEMFAAMAVNAGVWVERFSKLPLMIRDAVAQSVTGQNMKGLQQLEAATLAAVQAQGKMIGVTYDDIKAKAGLRAQLSGLASGLQNDVKFTEAMNEEMKKSPARQWEAMLDNLKQTLVTLVLPLLQLVSVIVAFINSLFGMPVVGTILKVIAVAIGVFVVASKLWSSSLMGLIVRFRLFGGAFSRWVTGLSTGATQASAALQPAGAGMRGFFAAFREIRVADVLKAALVMIILGGALIALGYGMKAVGVDGSQLMQFGLGLVAFAGALFIFSKVIDAAKSSIVKAAVIFGILAIALLGLGFALHYMATPHSPPPVEVLVILAGSLVILAAAAKIAGSATGDMIRAAIGLLVMGAALIPMAFAMNLMKDVGLGTVLMIILMVVVMAVVLAALSALAGPIILISVAFVIFGVALILIAVAALIAAHAFTMMAKLPLVQLAGGLLVLGAAVLIAGAMMMLGFPMMALAMLIGASMLITGMAFYLASIAIGAGIRNIMSSMGDQSSMRMAGASAAAMLYGISAGAVALVASPFARFWIASKSISAGIRNIVGSFTAADVAKVNDMTMAMKQLALTTGSMASRPSIEAMTRTASTVTVKTELEDRRVAERDRAAQMDLLSAIKNGIGELSATVKNASSAAIADRLDDIRKMLTRYLPEIAEADSGLSGSTNQWNSPTG